MAWDYEAVMRQLQDSVTVLSAMESRNSAHLKDHREWLESLQMAHEVERIANAERRRGQEAEMALHKERMSVHEERMARMDELLLEIGETLDAMINIVDGRRDKQ